jgi:hypothetical protein
VYYTFPAFARWALRKEETAAAPAAEVAPSKADPPVVDQAQGNPAENRDREPVTIGLRAATEGNCDGNKSQV